MSPQDQAAEEGEKELNKPSTPIKVQEMSRALLHHPNRSFVNFLLTGLTCGFMAGLSFLPSFTHICHNLLSAINEPGVVDRLLAREVERGIYVRPLF